MKKTLTDQDLVNWTEQVWLNGQIVSGPQALLAPNDRGFTLGDGLFETILWTGQGLRFFDDHMARLAHGAASLGFTLPIAPQALEDSLLAFAELAGNGPAALRLTLSRGLGPRGLAPPEPAMVRLQASLAPLSSPTHPASVVTTEIARNAGAPSSRFKTLSYIDNVAALMAARDQKADDGLMIGAEGRIACASSANLIANIQGRLVTPPVSDGALPGIIRGRLLRAGLIAEHALTNQDLAKATSAYLTNALISVRPIATIDGRPLALNSEEQASLLAALAT